MFGAGRWIPRPPPSPERLRSVPRIRRRWTVSHNVPAVAEPASTALLKYCCSRNRATEFWCSLSSWPVGSEVAGGDRSRQQQCYRALATQGPYESIIWDTFGFSFPCHRSRAGHSLLGSPLPSPHQFVSTANRQAGGSPCRQASVGRDSIPARKPNLFREPPRPP